MEIKLDHFMHDLVWLIKEEYNESLDRALRAESDHEKALQEGQSWAYHHVLELIESQLTAFGNDSPMFTNLAPEPGQKADFKKAEL